MRPYQLYKNGPWLDLDPLQVVSEVVLEPHFFLTLSLVFAFQPKPIRYVWDAKHLTKKGELDYLRNEAGVPLDVVEIREQILDPLLKAWKGETPK